jgi:hypothetical protein
VVWVGILLPCGCIRRLRIGVRRRRIPIQKRRIPIRSCRIPIRKRRILISVFAVRFKHSPHPNPPRGRGGSRGSSPVHGGGWEGGMLKNQRKDTYQPHRQSLQLPPSCRFPPLSEGNRERRADSVPPARRGNLKEGVFSRACFCKLCPRDWYHTTCGRRRRLVAGVAGGERTATGARNAARRCAPAVAGGDRGDSERDTRSPSDTSCLGRPAPVHMGRTGTLKAGQDKRGAPAPLRAAGRRGFSRGSAEAVRIYRLFLTVPADCLCSFSPEIGSLTLQQATRGVIAPPEDSASGDSALGWCETTGGV